MSVINTNIMSLVAQQNLNKSQSSLTTAMERLSSGMRINSARDDAAGQAIANRFTSQINGLNQAVRNANDGISIAQTTEGSLNQINDNLQTIRTLTVQAQNGTNSESDLQSIQDEISQRLMEIDRISAETDFNGTRVLAKGADDLRVQVGANDNQIIDIGLRNIDVAALGLSGFNVNGVGSDNVKADQQAVLAAGFVVDGTVDGKYNKDGFNEATTATELFANLKDGGTIKGSGGGNFTAVDFTYNADTNDFTYNQADVALTSLDADLGLTPGSGETTKLVVELGGQTTTVKVTSTGSLTDSAGQTLYLTGDAGEQDLSLTFTSGSAVATIEALVTELGARDGGTASTGQITTSDGTVYKTSTTGGSGTAIDVQNGTMSFEETLDFVDSTATADVAHFNFDMDGDANTTGDRYSIEASGAGAHSAETGWNLSGSDLFTSGFAGDNTLTTSSGASVFVNDNGNVTDGAANIIYVNELNQLTTERVSNSTVTEDPLAALDAALADVDSLRSELGAVQNRFADAIMNLETNSINLSDARSRIEDADYAKEVAEMTRAQILQQAGTSVLAQANQLPQNVLSLLG